MRSSTEPARLRFSGMGCIALRALGWHELAPGVMTTSTSPNLHVLLRPRWRIGNLLTSHYRATTGTLVQQVISTPHDRCGFATAPEAWGGLAHGFAGGIVANT